jgi:hypothetical protein
MGIFEQVLAFTVPAAIIGAIVFLLLNKLLKADEQRRNYELRKISAQSVNPAKLRALERMIIFLERIAPESILTRMPMQNTNALQLQKHLLQEIRQEWEHNISQQLYLQDDTWTMLVSAKESMIQLVNTCATEVTLDSTALEYAQHIVETYGKVPKTPSSVAKTMLKAELSQMK